jgi:hypothetical protein
MKIRTIVLAIATVLTLSQSAQANECKISELIKYTGEEVVNNFRGATIKQGLEGPDVPKLVEKISRYTAVLEYNEMYRKKVGCESYNLKSAKITEAERAAGIEAIIELDHILHN